MKARTLLAALALLAWAAAWLLPSGPGPGRTWWLLDASASMAGAVPPEESAVDPSRIRWFARGLARSAAAEQGREASALGAALTALRPELRAGDSLHVFTDGRNTDALPPRALFSDCMIVHHAPAPGPRIVELGAPPVWPKNGQLALEIRVLDAQFERAEIVVEADTGGVEILRAIPGGSRSVRLEVRARDPLRPPSVLRVRWREGARESARAVAVAATHNTPVRVVDPAQWSPSETDFVRAGGSLLLASTELAAWMSLPAECRPFQPQAAIPPLTVLLDRSGSMDQGGLNEARALLAGWAHDFAAGPGFRVQPFAAELEAPLDLRQAPDFARLEALLPYGPTRLTEALSDACASLSDDAILILISDGRAAVPPEGWASWTHRVIGNRRVFCVPAGADFDATVLAAIGETLTQGDFGSRLGQAFSRLPAPARADAFALPGASLPLPSRLALPEPRAPLLAAAGAETLMQDAAGQAVLTLRRVGAGAILGLAAPAEAGLPQALAATWEACQIMPSGWWNGRFILTAGPPPPRAAQDSMTLDLALLDAGPPARWEALRADTRQPVKVGDPAQGRGWIQPPAADAEWAASDEEWASWIGSAEGMRNRAGPRSTLLIAALVAASLVFLLADRARA